MTMPATDTTTQPPPPAPLPMLNSSVRIVDSIVDHRGSESKLVITTHSVTGDEFLVRLNDIDGKPIFGQIDDVLCSPPVFAAKDGRVIIITATPAGGSSFILRTSAPVKNKRIACYTLGL